MRILNITMEGLLKHLVLICGKACRNPCVFLCKIFSVFFHKSIVHVDFSLFGLTSCESESKESIGATTSLHWCGKLTISSVGFFFMLWSADVSAIITWNPKSVSTEEE